MDVQHYLGRDGEKLAYREVGEGRPLILIHGFFSTAFVNWIRYGQAEYLAGLGYRVIMPDLRGHGDSSRSHDPAHYPSDVLGDDALALIEHLGVTDYDLGGYSLGGRTTVRAMVRGATPRRAIVAGMGLGGITHTEGRTTYFRNVLTHLGEHQRGTSEWKAEAFLKTTKSDPVAMLHVIEASVDTSLEELAEIDIPTLALCGTEDVDRGSAEELAESIRNAVYQGIPGDHMSAVAKMDLGVAIGDFLA